LTKFSLQKMVEGISFMPQLDLIVQMMANQKKGIKLDFYKYQINHKFYLILDNQDAKVCLGEDYNFIFLKKAIQDYKVGFFMRWGKTTDDDPKFSPIGPEILDIEISINGCKNSCPFCSPKGTYINTPSGVKQIEQIQKGDEVIGYDLSSNRQIVQKVVELYKRYYNGEMIDIELDNGRILSLTPEHEVYIKNNGLKKAKELTSFDDIIGV